MKSHCWEDVSEFSLNILLGLYEKIIRWGQSHRVPLGLHSDCCYSSGNLETLLMPRKESIENPKALQMKSLGALEVILPPPQQAAYSQKYSVIKLVGKTQFNRIAGGLSFRWHTEFCFAVSDCLDLKKKKLDVRCHTLRTCFTICMNRPTCCIRRMHVLYSSVY